MKQYVNMNTDEVVYEEEAKDYVLEKLGLTMKPVGKDGVLTNEQIEFIDQFVNWYFSGNWTEERVKDEDIPDLEYELEIEDIRYQDSLDRKWGLI